MDDRIRDLAPLPRPIREEGAPQVMTSVEAAAYLKMHVKTVCRLAKEGRIPARKVGSEWRFLRSVLDAWLTEVMA